MQMTVWNLSLLATDLEAKGIVGGIGKFLLIIIVVLLLVGVFIGMKMGKRHR
jgi:hypothetical protein